jgi:Protein of unknown function (DUF3575)
MRHTLSAALFALFIPATALAQTAATPTDPYNQVLSMNPFGLVLKWANAEYERKISPAMTLGASASHLSDLDQSSAAIVLRWYPQRTALEGFYLGVHTGAYRFKAMTYDFRSYHERNRVLPGAGVELGHNWLLGPRHNVSVGVGGGLTRIATSSDSYSAPSVLPGFRLNVGIAF